MIEMSVSAIALAVNGKVLGDEQAIATGSVETDSRLVSAGSLFVAKPGEFADGHDFVLAAQRGGAVAAIVERPVEGTSLAQIVVGDAVLALGRLAKHVVETVRAEGILQVIGITGSNGKTSTKNMLNAVLSDVAPTVSPIESFNNEVGAPISMLKIDRATKFLIVEMGAGGEGSIHYLADMARPNIGVMLKVGLAHVGEFGGIETTARIKAELVRALGPEDSLVLNADDGVVADMAQLTEATKYWFGTNPDAGYRAIDIDSTIDGVQFSIQYPDGFESRVRLRILGEHQAYNAMATLAVADALGLDRTSSIASLEKLELAERWRMQPLQRADGILIINDAYNASPDSTKAALQTLAHLGKSGRRTVAVLGEMAELGSQSVSEHDAIGRIVVRLNIDELVVIGQGAKLIHMGAMQEGSWDGESKFFDSIDEAKAYLRGMLATGDIVLVKSSKSANLRYLGDELMEVNP